MKKAFIQQPGKALSPDGQFLHVMAIALDPRSGYSEGVIRCIVSRKGDVAAKGFIDISEIHHLSKRSGSFVIGEKVKMKNEPEIISKLSDGFRFVGLEDPDIWIDEGSGMLHLYFTLPMLSKNEDDNYNIHLGHAIGKDLFSLEMTEPVLLHDSIGGAKELSIAPVNRDGVRLNLVESEKSEVDFKYSTVRVAIAKDMGGPWKFGDTVFHPKEHGIPWIAGHASPGPLFPKSFLDIGEGKLVGIMNGREANRIVDGEIQYGAFSAGLFIYDYEKGKIEWVSSETLVSDTEARTITFASQFVPTSAGQGILYAHVDDSFVRAYSLDAEGIKSKLPE